MAVYVDHELVHSLDRLSQVAALPSVDLEDGDLEAERRELKALYSPMMFNYVFIADRDGNVLLTEPVL